MFKDTNSHRLDSTQFMCVSGKFFGVNISTVKGKKTLKIDDVTHGQALIEKMKKK